MRNEGPTLAVLQAELQLRNSCLGADHASTIEILHVIQGIEAEAGGNAESSVRVCDVSAHATPGPAARPPRGDDGESQESQGAESPPCGADDSDESSSDAVHQAPACDVKLGTEKNGSFPSLSGASSDEDGEGCDEVPAARDDAAAPAPVAAAAPADFWPGSTKRIYGKRPTDGAVRAAGGGVACCGDSSGEGGGSSMKKRRSGTVFAPGGAPLRARNSSENTRGDAEVMKRVGFYSCDALDSSTDSAAAHASPSVGSEKRRGSGASRIGKECGELSAAAQAELAEQRAYFFEVDSFEIDRGGDGGF